MSFRLDWISVGSVVALGALVSTACQTPGEDYQENPAAGTGSTASNASASATTNPATSTTSGSGAGGASAATSDATSTVDGASATSSDGAAATSDASTSTSDASTSTDGGSSGGAGSTDSAVTTDGGGGGGNGSNLIQNGDFSSSENPCSVDDSDWFTEGTLNWSGADETTCSYCVVLDPDQSGQLNWSGNAGTPPTLEPGNYRFAFDVWSPEGEQIPSVSAKVGQPVDPYTGFVEEEINVTNSQATQSFNFTMANADQAGIAFFLSVGGAWGKVCFDNVVLEPQ